MYKNLLLVLIVLWSSFAVADENDWPSWRGAAQTGSKLGGDYPDVLDASTLVWKTELPGRGCSTPIVLDKTIYVTLPINDVDSLVALDWAGQKLWDAGFGKQLPGKHRNGSGSNASPVTDGNAIFCYFKSGTLGLSLIHI